MGVYQRSDSPTYWMSLQVNGRRVRLNTMVQDRRLAEEIFSAWKVEQARIRWFGAPPPEQDHTVQDLLEEYLAKVTPRKSPDSQRRDHGVLTRLSEEWGALTLEELDAKMIEDYMAERLEEVSFATVSKEVGMLKSAYGRAIRWGWATRNPFVDITLNQQGDERIRWLTAEEEVPLLEACQPWLRDIAIVGLDTGLRRGNLVGLQRAWVHQGGTLLIIPKESVKTKKLTVTIPLTRRAAEIIARRLLHSDREHVFVQDDGNPYRRDQVSKAFHRAAHAARLRDVCLHTLRHTFISRLVQAGRPLAEVAALAGHRDIRMTMRYAHLAPNHLQDGINALEAGATQRRLIRSQKGLASIA